MLSDTAPLGMNLLQDMSDVQRKQNRIFLLEHAAWTSSAEVALALQDEALLGGGHSTPPNLRACPRRASPKLRGAHRPSELLKRATIGRVCAGMSPGG